MLHFCYMIIFFIFNKCLVLFDLFEYKNLSIVNSKTENFYYLLDKLIFYNYI